jgi:type VI secretion system protein ImpA
MRDILIARGEMPAPADVEPMSAATIEAIFSGADADALQAAAEAAREAAADLTGIEQFLGEQVGAHQAPDLSPLGRTLRDIDRTLAQQLRRRGLSDGAGEPLPAADGPGAADGMEQGPAPVRPAGAQGFTGEIQNRADVLRALDQIARYYEAQEPSSPVPLLLQRAKRLVSMSFLEALTDLAPDGLPQIQIIGGIKPAEEEEE